MVKSDGDAKSERIDVGGKGWRGYPMNQWQPIETAPKDGTEIILYFPSLVHSIQIANWHHAEYFTNGKKTFESCRWTIGSILGDPPEPTHWMFLPEPPK